MIPSLASYDRCLERMAANWPGFLTRRRELLSGGAERVTESIIVDLFTSVLDWSLSDIYRHRCEAGDAALRLLSEPPVVANAVQLVAGGTLLHPKYQVPSSCFAYVGDASDPRTWKLPYCLSDGTVDLKRLPKAIQAMLSNYRGVRVSGIPKSAASEVLVRLARAAVALGKMPHQTPSPAAVYQQLAEALAQLERLVEITDGNYTRRPI